MQGFKSFVRKTELPFTPGINVILGPNGSGKSNVSDALCFVLGRLSIKSMRAAKASNLIFMGSKAAAPAKEAIVELVFDNTDKTFAVDSDEVSLKRIVRKNGLSIYKINGETKTRQDVLSLLAQAGIDPNGFNIILQGEIQNFVRMHNEERRKIVEEVAGISIYESRKEKSLKELDKTEEKLKEVSAVLRERTTYLNNLEKERQEALKFKKLEQDVKNLKASIIFHDLTKKKKESDLIVEEIEKHSKHLEKLKKNILEIQSHISNHESKINSINSTIQQSTGLEQEKLNQEIANLRAELAGLNVKKENYENKISDVIKQKAELEQLVRTNELSIVDLQKESPTVVKKQKELDEKKKELEKLEEQRKKFYMFKSELKSIKERIQDKNSLLAQSSHESEFLLKHIESLGSNLFDSKSTQQKVDELKLSLVEKKDQLSKINIRSIELEKLIHTNEFEIEQQNKIVEKISKLDICPVCKSKVTKEHLEEVHKEMKPKLVQLKSQIESAEKELKDIYQKKEILNQDIDQISQEISQRQSDLIKLSNIEEKKEQIKVLHEKTENSKKELADLEKRKKHLEENFDESSNIEQKYETVRVEIQEISLRSEENVNSEISFKKRELERSKISLKQLAREEVDLKEELAELKMRIADKDASLIKKRQQEEALSKKFQSLLAERDGVQKKIREIEGELSVKRNEVHNTENTINNIRISKAKVDAEVENLEIEILEFPNAEMIKIGRDALTEKLAKTQETISRIGSVNLRSLEVYDEIKKEYDSIKDKVDVISKEKEGILKIIAEIDIKKRKAFLKTLEALNEIFSRNFAQISTKGQVSLELENKKDPFEGGVAIQVKTGHGKYFDVTSLSGGEQTMVALSLIFAIQEFRPYCFYILDEIDAALDKRNSERLASLLKKYMQQGQYIVITHNDEIITNATNLYGVSMHEGISKVVSMQL